MLYKFRLYLSLYSLFSGSKIKKEIKKKEYPSEKFSAKKKKYLFPPLKIMHELQKFYALL